MTKAQDRFNNDYLYVRKQLIGGRNPFVTPQSMRDWISQRVDGVVDAIVEERMKLVKRMGDSHADRELEIYHRLKRRNGETEDDD